MEIKPAGPAGTAEKRITPPDSSAPGKRIVRKHTDKVKIELTEHDTESQMDRLQEEMGLNEAEAGFFQDMARLFVERKSEELNKDWSSDAIRAISNMFISMIVQEQKQANDLKVIVARGGNNRSKFNTSRISRRNHL